MIAVMGLLSIGMFIVSLVGMFLARWRRVASVALAVSCVVFVSAVVLSPDAPAREGSRAVKGPLTVGDQPSPKNRTPLPDSPAFRSGNIRSTPPAGTASHLQKLSRQASDHHAKAKVTGKLAFGQVRIVRNASGCTSQSYFEKLAGFMADRDKAAWMSAMQAGYRTGICTRFATGEIVYLEKAPLFDGAVLIRRPGETQTYWTYFEAVN